MPNQAEIINQDYQKDCLLRHNVIGLPTMSQISEDGTLSLTGYKVNSGLCAALGDFLGKNTHQTSPYIVRNLVLDDNGINDLDFANILRGIR
jgi:hypothetical protein